MLRHPVLISTLEEDFKKIGLLKESAPATEEPNETDLDSENDESEEQTEGKRTWLKYKVGGDNLNKQDPARKDGHNDYAESEDDITEADVAAYEEAVEFAEAFDEEWDEADPDSEVVLTKGQMEELESMGESLGLDFDVLAEDDEDDEDLIDEDGDEDDDEDEDDSDEDE